MKFSYKILLTTIVVMAVAFGVGGYFFVDYVFQTSLQREIEQAMDESSILQFAFETAALNVPSKYDVLRDTTVEEIGLNLEKGGQATTRLLRLSNEDKVPLYASEGFVEDTDFLMQIDAQTRIYQVMQYGERYYIQTGAVLNTLDRILYLETMKDVTQVYQEKTQGFFFYRQLTLVILVCSSVFMLFLSYWMTKPIRLLTKATRKMTEGDYGYRAEVISSDEMGQLTDDFNHMAGVLEENIHKLENEVRAREDFIAAFSHELKTPLTAIIGYADLLRSRKLDEEQEFLSANYIYTEGKRLETMAFRLLDIIVTKRFELDGQFVDVRNLFRYLEEMYAEKQEIQLRIYHDADKIWGDVNLLKSLLLNLVDNAFKASEPGGVVEVKGQKREDGYLFSVKDYGVGIPEEECHKITEAFYMVDKSRSRSKNGAGLGLALCVEILRLHDAELKIDSKLGEGTCISFLLPKRKQLPDEETITYEKEQV